MSDAKISALLAGTPSSPAVAHLVFLKLKPTADAADVFDQLRSLKAQVPGMLSFAGGANTNPEGLSRGYTHSFCMHFVDAAARDAYLPHPDHERVKALILQNVEPEGACVMDFDLPPSYFTSASVAALSMQ